MVLSPKKRKWLIAGVAASSLATISVLAYFYNSEYFNSCEADLNELIDIYNSEQKVASLLKDSSKAKKLFSNIESQECYEKEAYSKLYDSLLIGIRNNTLDEPINKDSIQPPSDPIGSSAPPITPSLNP